MVGFGRSSSSALALVLAAAMLPAACVDEKPGVSGTTSLSIDLVSPTDLGSIDDRLPDSARTITFNVTALDAQNVLDPTLSGTLDIYAHFLGSLTPEYELGRPLATVEMTEGVANNVTVDLPRAFGQTFLWVEHASGPEPTFATGTSPTLWYRDPFIVDISDSSANMGNDVFDRSPLEAKQIRVKKSRYGANGRLVVTAVYAQGYTVSDVECQDASGTPPCVAGAYDHVLVFTFSRPEDDSHDGLRRGHVVTEFNGAIAEFNGLTEVNFPKTYTESDDPNVALLPAPVVIDPDWILEPPAPELEQVEAGLIAVENATMCPLDQDWDEHTQWKLDLGHGCDQPMNVISNIQVPDFDPAAFEGQVIPRVVGTLQPVNINDFYVWIMFPRDSSDLTLP